MRGRKHFHHVYLRGHFLVCIYSCPLCLCETNITTLTEVPLVLHVSVQQLHTVHVNRRALTLLSIGLCFVDQPCSSSVRPHNVCGNACCCGRHDVRPASVQSAGPLV